MAPVHDRMPVILASDRWEQWLNPANDDPEVLRAMLLSAPNDVLTMHAVSTQVNSVRNKNADLITPVAPLSGPTGLFDH